MRVCKTERGKGCRNRGAIERQRKGKERGRDLSLKRGEMRNEERKQRC